MIMLHYTSVVKSSFQSDLLALLLRLARGAFFPAIFISKPVNPNPIRTVSPLTATVTSTLRHQNTCVDIFLKF